MNDLLERRCEGGVLGNGIDTAWIPGMAAGDAFQAEASTFAGAVLFNGLGGVIGTTRKKATVLPQQRADRVFVTANQKQKQLHGLSPVLGNLSRSLWISPVNARLSMGKDGLVASRTIKS